MVVMMAKTESAIVSRHILRRSLQPHTAGRFLWFVSRFSC